MKLLPALSYDGYKLRSKPLTIENIEMKLQGLQIGLAQGFVDKEDALEQINEACGTHMKYSEPEQTPTATVDPATGKVVNLPANQNVPAPKNPKPGVTFGGVPPTGKAPTLAMKAEGESVVSLAKDFLVAIHKQDRSGIESGMTLIARLDALGKREFFGVVADLKAVNPAFDRPAFGSLMVQGGILLGASDGAQP